MKSVDITASKDFEWNPKLKATNDLFLWVHVFTDKSASKFGFWYGVLKNSNQN